jgi:phosphoglucosamine mutase
MKREGRLPGDAIVATVMSNLGLRLFAKEHDLTIPVTDVGDRNVLEKMEECGYALGGEQSGHMIFRQFATTGDGELTALQLLQILRRSSLKASELFSQCKKYPQYLINIPVADNAMKAKIMGEPELQSRVKQEEETLAGEGRILVRPSGTEALIRVMVEGKDPELSQTCARNLAEFIRTL